MIIWKKSHFHQNWSFPLFPAKLIPLKISQILICTIPTSKVFLMHTAYFYCSCFICTYLRRNLTIKFFLWCYRWSFAGRNLYNFYLSCTFIHLFWNHSANIHIPHLSFYRFLKSPTINTIPLYTWTILKSRLHASIFICHGLIMIPTKQRLWRKVCK